MRRQLGDPRCRGASGETGGDAGEHAPDEQPCRSRGKQEDGIAPLLARSFTLVCADLRGYGRSACPRSAPDHAPYSKQAMAREMLVVMERLGFRRFFVGGHDRGGRVAYRLAMPATADRAALACVGRRRARQRARRWPLLR